MEGAVLVLLGLYLFGHTLPRAWRTLNTDFPNYYLAVRLVHDGVDHHAPTSGSGCSGKRTTATLIRE